MGLIQHQLDELIPSLLISLLFSVYFDKIYSSKTHSLKYIFALTDQLE